MRRDGFARGCGVGAAGAAALGVVSVTLWGFGSLLGVGALSLAGLLLSLGGLTVLIELLDGESAELELVPVEVVELTSDLPKRALVRPVALLPSGPVRLLLEPPALDR